MLTLARQLSAYDDPQLQGWMIGKAIYEYLPDGMSGPLEIKRSRGLCILEASCLMTDGSGRRLKIFLMKPTAGKKAAVRMETEADIGINTWKAFSNAEIDTYLHDTNDQNHIHTGDHPVVPGLLILDHLLGDFDITGTVQIRFHDPLYARQMTGLVIENNQLHGFTEERLVFSAVMKEGAWKRHLSWAE